MGWIRYHDDNGDGLQLTDEIHFDESALRGLIDELDNDKWRQYRPKKVCSQLRQFLEGNLERRRIKKELVWQLSKWCDWRNKEAVRIAREIAEKLFYGVVCRRLLDQNDKPKPEETVADADYQRWIQDVISLSQGQTQEASFPDEIDEAMDGLHEGAVKQVKINAYERNREARNQCIKHYGSHCCICGFSFADTYDGTGDRFIHVHHLTPMSKIGKDYKVDPIKDLRPVCPNCHAVIHKYKEPFTIDEVKGMLSKNASIGRSKG